MLFFSYRLLYARHLLKRCVPQRWTAHASRQSVELSKPFSVSSAVHVSTNRRAYDEGVKNAKSVSLEFSDKAYAERPTGELLRAWFVYNMFAFKFLVNRGDKVAHALSPTRAVERAVPIKRGNYARSCIGCLDTHACM